MDLSVGFMSSVLGGIGIVAYMAAPFLEDNKKAWYARLISQFFLGLMFFYIGCLAGVSYYAVLLLSALFQKQIECNKRIGFAYGIFGMIVTLVLNNNGIPGVVLAASIILLFLPVDEERMLTTTAYVDVVSALALAYYSISVRCWVSLIFSVLLLIIAVAGLVSNIQLARAGGLSAARKEEMQYQKAQKEKREAKKKNPKKVSRKKS